MACWTTIDVKCECGNTVQLTYGRNGVDNREFVEGKSKCTICGNSITCDCFGKNIKMHSSFFLAKKKEKLEKSLYNRQKTPVDDGKEPESIRNLR